MSKRNEKESATSFNNQADRLQAGRKFVDRIPTSALRAHGIIRVPPGTGANKKELEMKLVHVSDDRLCYRVKLGGWYVHVHCLMKQTMPRMKTSRMKQQVERILHNGSKVQLEAVIREIAIAKLSSAMNIGPSWCKELQYDAVITRNSVFFFVKVESSQQVAPEVRYQGSLETALAALHSMGIVYGSSDYHWRSDKNMYVLSDFTCADYVGSEDNRSKTLFQQDIDRLKKVRLKKLKPQQENQKGWNVQDSQSVLEYWELRYRFGAYSRQGRYITATTHITQPQMDQIVEALVSQRDSLQIHAFLVWHSQIDPNINLKFKVDVQPLKKALRQPLTIKQCLDIQPNLTDQVKTRFKMLFGHHNILDSPTIGDPIALKEYYVFVQLHIFALGTEAQEQFREFRQSKSVIAQHERFPLVRQLLLGHYQISLSLREYLIGDLLRMNDSAYLQLLKKILDRKIRFSELYSYASKVHQVERCVFIVALYGKIGPNPEDDSEMSEFQDGFSSLVYIALMALRNSFPWGQMEAVLLFRLLTLSTDNPQRWRNCLSVAMQCLELEEEDSYPLSQLARINLRLLKARQLQYTTTQQSQLLELIHRWSLYHCYILSPRQCFEHYNLIHDLFQLQKREPLSLTLRKELRKDWSVNPQSHGMAIRQYYRVLSEAILSLDLNEYYLGEEKLYLAESILSHNSEKFDFYDQAQLLLAKVDWLISTHQISQAQDLLKVIKEYPDPKYKKRLQNDILKAQIKLDMKLGSYDQALIKSSKLVRKGKAAFNDALVFMLHQNRLRLQLNDFETGITGLEQLKQKLVERINFGETDGDILKPFGGPRMLQLVQVLVLLSEVYLNLGKFQHSWEACRQARLLGVTHKTPKELLRRAESVLNSVGGILKKSKSQMYSYNPRLDANQKADIVIGRLEGQQNQLQLLSCREHMQRYVYYEKCMGSLKEQMQEVDMIKIVRTYFRMCQHSALGGNFQAVAQFHPKLIIRMRNTAVAEEHEQEKRKLIKSAQQFLDSSKAGRKGHRRPP